MSVCRCFECGNDSGKWEEEMIRLKAHRMIMQQKKHRLTRAHREKQLKMSCQALHNAPPNRT